MNFLFSLDFDVSSDPEFLTDKGTATAEVKDCIIRLDLSQKTDENGILEVSFTQAEIILNDYEVKTQGEKDLSKALETIFQQL